MKKIIRTFVKVLPWLLVVIVIAGAVADRVIMTRTVQVWQKVAFHFALAYQRELLPEAAPDFQVVDDAANDILAVIQDQDEGSVSLDLVPEYVYQEQIQYMLTCYDNNLRRPYSWSDKLATFGGRFALGLP